MMDQFENQVATLNTQGSYMDLAMGATSQHTTPSDQVDELIQRVAETHGLDIAVQLRTESTPSSVLAHGSGAIDQNDELTERLNALRNRQ